MENETKQILKHIFANQVIIYKRLEEIEFKIKGGVRSAPIKTYIDDLKKKAAEVLKFID